MKFLSGLMVLTVLLLNSCSGSIYQQEPVPMDSDPNALKKSPCACLEVEIIRELPSFLINGTEV